MGSGSFFLTRWGVHIAWSFSKMIWFICGDHHTKNACYLPYYLSQGFHMWEQLIESVLWPLLQGQQGVIKLKRPYISLITGSRASKCENKTLRKSCLVNLLQVSNMTLTPVWTSSGVIKFCLPYYCSLGFEPRFMVRLPPLLLRTQLEINTTAEVLFFYGNLVTKNHEYKLGFPQNSSSKPRANFHIGYQTSGSPTQVTPFHPSCSHYRRNSHVLKLPF